EAAEAKALDRLSWGLVPFENCMTPFRHRYHPAAPFEPAMSEKGWMSVSYMTKPSPSWTERIVNLGMPASGGPRKSGAATEEVQRGRAPGEAETFPGPFFHSIRTFVRLS